jgi:hypothetical protein
VLLASFQIWQLSANRKERTACSLAECDETKVSPYHSVSQTIFLVETPKTIALSRGNLAYENINKEVIVSAWRLLQCYQLPGKKILTNLSRYILNYLCGISE